MTTRRRIETKETPSPSSSQNDWVRLAGHETKETPSPSVVLVACALLAWPAIGRAETRPAYGGAVEASLLSEPIALDPVAAQSHAELTVVALVFDTLYALSPDGVAAPHLALGPPELNAARTVAHIALRRGVVFHDGSPLTAADVAASLERTRTAVGWVLAPVASIRASGDGVDLTLRTPAADLPTLLALPQTSITRRGQAPAAQRPIGSGPFAVDGIDRAGHKLTLRAFDDHFAGRSYLDQLVLGWFDSPDGEVRRFETGSAQLSARGVAAFAGARPMYPAAAVESPAALLVFVGFGKLHPQITADRGFRSALDLALDRDALAKITSGERTLPARLPLPIAAGGVVLGPAGRAGNLAAAQAQLAASRNPALAPAGLAALRLTIVIDQTRPDDREIALRVSRGLERLGIGFTIDVLAPEVLRERVSRGDCDLWIGQLAAPITVATAWWGAAFAAGGDGWVAGVLAQGALDPAEVARQFAARLPIVPLMFRSLLVWHRVEVRGLEFDASARPGLADLYWWKPKKPRATP
jgi:peptide/nickel transport system substrate-binding protein